MPVIESTFPSSETPDLRYIDTEGKAYDIHYNPIDSTNEKLLNIVNLAKHKPQPQRFDSYFEYEQALVEWRFRLEKDLKSVYLPVPLGRYYYRPNFSLVVKSMSYVSFL